MSFNVPAIPAGAQLGGAGTAENQSGAPAPQIDLQYQAPVEASAPTAAGAPPVPVWNGTAWELPQTTVQPSSPLAPAAQAPVPVPTADQPINIETAQQPTIQVPVAEAGESYLETSINHFAAETGFDGEAIMASIEKALEHGDAGLIHVNHDGKLTPEQAQRATQLAQMAYQHTQAEITNMQNTVYQVAGGQAQWDSSVNAFNASATDEAKSYVDFLVNHKRDAKAAAEYITKFVSGNGLTTQITQAPIQGATGAPVVGGLTKQAYSDGIHNLEMRLNLRQVTHAQYEAEMADLDYRRGVGRKAGI